MPSSSHISVSRSGVTVFSLEESSAEGVSSISAFTRSSEHVQVRTLAAAAELASHHRPSALAAAHPARLGAALALPAPDAPVSS